MYTPLIDMTPSDTTTIKTAKLEVRRLTKKAGQATAIFTADLQLYHVGLNVQWANPGSLESLDFSVFLTIQCLDIPVSSVKQKGGLTLIH